MYRTPVYDAPPQEDAVMADGKMIGGTLFFNDDVKLNKERTDVLKGDKSFFSNQLENDIDKTYRPPYAPKLSNTEITDIKDWIQKQEKRIIQLEQDPAYQFIKLVAGNLSRDVDNLLKFDTERRHNSEAFFDVPGKDSFEDLVEGRKNVIREIAKIKAEIDLRQLYLFFESVLKAFLTVPNSDNKKMINPLTRNSKIDDIFKQKLATLVNLNNNTDLGRELYGKLYNLISQNLQRFPGLKGEKDFDVFDIVNWLQEKSSYYVQSSSQDVTKTAEIYSLEYQQKSLEDLIDRLDVTSARRRKYAALNWLERPEIMGMADMTPELFMGVDKAITLVKLNVSGFRALPDSNTKTFDIIVKSKMHTFITLFAELTARQMNLAHFFEGLRGSFDKNHARVRLSIERLLKAMRHFKYSDNKILDARSNNNDFFADRLDFT